MDIYNTAYVYIDDDEKLNDHISFVKGCGIIGIDTETTGLDPFRNKIRLLQISCEDHPVLVIDMFKMGDNGIDIIRKLLEENSIKIFQNSKFDIKFLEKSRIKIKGPIFDTMIAAQVVRDNDGPAGFSLEVLAEYYLGIKISKEERKSDWGGVLTQRQIEYAAKDAAILIPLREKIIEEIKKANLVEACKLEFDCVWAVVDMELSGIGLNREKWGKLTEEYVTRQKEVSLKLNQELSRVDIQIGMFEDRSVGGINLDSQSQVLKAFRRRGIDLKSTSHSELVEYKEKYEEIRDFLEYRRISKALQGFLYPIPQYINPETGRIHSSYRQIGAYSGRFSCGDPNIQQIPRGKEFRECFVPSAGNKFVIADYSQIELRVAAEIANDKTMIEAYKSGQDLHALTASLIAGKDLKEVTKKERQAAKAVNFGLIYAMGARGLMGYAKTVYGIEMSLEEAEIFRERFFRAYNGIANWHAKKKNETNITEVRTLSGRRCTFNNPLGITALLNTPVQGTAADITKKALGMIVPVIRELNGCIVATVHDEIILEVPSENAETAANKLKEIMEKAGKHYLKHIPVIAETGIGDSWAEK